MGQPIQVTEKPTPDAGVVRFEIDRSLTGMDHECYAAGSPVTGDRPPDELARRLFDTGKAASVHVYSNIITVELARGQTADGLAEIIGNLYIHYTPGTEPTPV